MLVELTMYSNQALGKAIKYAREDAGMNLRELSEKCGWSHPALQKRETGETRIKPPDLKAIAKATGWTVERIEAMAERFEAAQPDDPTSRPQGMIPVVNVAPAGPLGDYIEWGGVTADAPEYIDAGGLEGTDLFAVRVVGKSMEPNLWAGDVVVFRWLNQHEGHFPILDKTVVFVRLTADRDNLCTIGRWLTVEHDDRAGQAKIQIKKDHPDYPALNFDREEIEQVGRFVERRTRRM